MESQKGSSCFADLVESPVSLVQLQKEARQLPDAELPAIAVPEWEPAAFGAGLQSRSCSVSPSMHWVGSSSSASWQEGSGRVKKGSRSKVGNL